MVPLRFRAPGRPRPLATLVSRAWPEASPAEVAALLRAGRALVEGRVWRDPGAEVAAGQRVELQAGARAPRAAPQPRVRARGADWTLLEKPRGWPGGAARVAEPELAPLLAEMLGAAATGARPLQRLDSDAGGLWLIAHGKAAQQRLAAVLAGPDALLDVRALVAPALAWRRGCLVQPLDGQPAETQFEVLEERDGIAELQLRVTQERADSLRRQLAGAGAAILGDARFGGVMVAGGLRLWTRALRIPSEGIEALAELPADFWPDEPVFAPDAGARGEEAQPSELVVSDATLRALTRGHPWILTDSETSDTGRFRPGTLVRVRSAAGKAGGLARIEGQGAVAARLWAAPPLRPRDAPSVEARVAEALARRKDLLSAAADPEATDAFRLIHGEGDDLPGLVVDRLGGCLRVLVTGRSCDGFRARALDALLRALARDLGPDPARIEAIHLRERPAGRLECVRLAAGALPADFQRDGGRLRVRERGLVFLVDPGLARPEQASPGVGLFLDQRENRARLAERARRGGRWLNLFAHTGAFSVALLAAGAREVVSVDLSAAYLRWLEENLAANGLAGAPHRALQGDGRRVLTRLPARERFTGIVLDPPTAAAAGRSFWSVRRDLPPLVAAALRCLEPGGLLLVSRNDRAARGELAALVRAAATQAGVGVARIEPAAPGADFPSRRGFPEGDPFEAVLLQLG